MTRCENLFIVGAGFTKAAFPDAPLNDELTDAVCEASGSPSVLRSVKEYYEEGSIETLLSRLDLDILTRRGPFQATDRSAIEFELADYVAKFRFRQAVDIAPLVPLVEALRDGDVLVSLNYDCFLEGMLDHHDCWSPNGGHLNIDYPFSDDIRPNPRGILILKPHGSESFRSSKFFDRPDWRHVDVIINEELFPKSGANLSFGVGGGSSEPHLIAPSFVKRLSVELQYQLLHAVESAAEARNLVVLGCGLRPEDGHLWSILTNFLRGPGWSEKRIIILSPNAGALAKRVRRHWSRDIFNDQNFVALDGALQEKAEELAKTLAG